MYKLLIIVLFFLVSCSVLIYPKVNEKWKLKTGEIVKIIKVEDDFVYFEYKNDTTKTLKTWFIEESKRIK